MKKALFLATLITGALLLSGCELFLTAPGIHPGTPVTIDDNNGVQETLGPGEVGRYEITGSSQPLRVDVYQETPGPDGELEVRVNDGDNIAYAHTNNRSYFQSTEIPLQSNGVHAAGPTANAPYSINLPANFGKAYIIVRNHLQASQDITVKVFTRNEVVRDGFAMNAPSGGATSVGYGGAVLFLNQRDTYTYAGASNQLLKFTPADAANPVKLKAVLNPGQSGETELAVGVDVNLSPGDKVEVFAEGGARAGFCQNLSGCADGIETGEYTLTIH